MYELVNADVRELLLQHLHLGIIQHAEYIQIGKRLHILYFPAKINIVGISFVFGTKSCPALQETCAGNEITTGNGQILKTGELQDCVKSGICETVAVR